VLPALKLDRHTDKSELPPGVLYLRKMLNKSKSNREFLFRLSVFVLTYLAYVSYHMSRKPISVVKNSKEFIACTEDGTSCKSWISEIDGQPLEDANSYLGLLDTVYLVSYALFMFASGFIAERSNLRNFLAFGMIMSGICTAMFGWSLSVGIRSIWFLLFVQLIGGMFQSSGWPGVVTVMANWFGKGKRGFIMGIWNSHTSVGNIMGSLIAGAYVNHNWGLSFIVPGLLMCVMGIIIYMFLVSSPEQVGMETGSVSPTTETAMIKPDLLMVRTPTTAGLLKVSSSSKLTDSPYSSDTEFVSLPKQGPIGFCGALRIPGVVEFSMCLFFAKLVSYTFLYWLPNYIHHASRIDAKESAVMSTYFDIGGIIGGIFAGFISDKSGMSATTCAVLLASAVPTLFFYELGLSSTCPLQEVDGIPLKNSCFVLNCLLLMITGMLVNGPYALITTAVSAELGTHKSLKGSSKALATVTAIIDGTGSLGAAIGPFMAGYLTGHGSWSHVFNMLVLSNLFALFFLSRLVRREIKRWYRRRYSF